MQLAAADRHRKAAVLGQLDASAHGFERTRDAAHRSSAQARVAHEAPRHSGTSHHAGEQASARAAVPAIEVARGITQSAQPDAGDRHVVGERRHIDAERAQDSRGRVDVGGAKDRPHARRPLGERAADQ